VGRSFVKERLTCWAAGRVWTGSLPGAVVATVATVVGTGVGSGVGAGVAGAGGVLDVQPAASTQRIMASAARINGACFMREGLHCVRISRLRFRRCTGPKKGSGTGKYTGTVSSPVRKTPHVAGMSSFGAVPRSNCTRAGEVTAAWFLSCLRRHTGSGTYRRI
jgi:hypothetical protein